MSVLVLEYSELRERIDGLLLRTEQLAAELKDIRSDRDKWRHRAEDAVEEKDLWKERADAAQTGLAILEGAVRLALMGSRLPEGVEKSVRILEHALSEVVKVGARR